MKEVITLYLQPLLGSDFKDFADERGLSYNISFCNPIDLTFTDHIHRFTPLERLPGRVEELKPRPGLMRRLINLWSCSTNGSGIYTADWW